MELKSSVERAVYPPSLVAFTRRHSQELGLERFDDVAFAGVLLAPCVEMTFGAHRGSEAPSCEE